MCAEFRRSIQGPIVSHMGQGLLRKAVNESLPPGYRRSSGLKTESIPIEIDNGWKRVRYGTGPANGLNAARLHSHLWK